MGKVYKDDLTTGNSEEKVLMNNIMSLLQELKGMEDSEDEMGKDLTQDGTETDVDNDVKMSMKKGKVCKEDEEDEDEITKSDDEDEDDVNKALEDTDSEGETANSDAEERVEDNTDLSEENVNEVAKAFVNILRKQFVKKSKPTANQQLVKVLKGIVEKQNILETAVVKVLKGLDIEKEIAKSYQNDRPQQIRKGLNDVSDVTRAFEYIAKSMGKSEVVDSNKGSNIESVRKSLSNKDLLSALVVRK